MERICITYHMSKMVGKASDKDCAYDTAENCITTCFTDDIAAELLAGKVPIGVSMWLNLLAELQGYEAASFCMAEKAPL